MGTELKEHDQVRRTGEHGARVGGRSERVVSAVMSAATAELARVGFAALRVEDVALQAGVNKTTVYRRWPTKLALVGDALHECLKYELREPHTGALRTDLVELSRQLVAARVDRPQALTKMVMAEMDRPDVAELVRKLRDSWVAPWIAVVRRAIDTGELPRGTDPQLFVDVVLGALLGRLRRREPVDDAYREAVIDLVLRGAEQSGAIVKRRRG
jgi:AcrR family transcriptional regulator